MRLLLIILIGLGFTAVNSSLGLTTGSWQFWAYLGLMLAFSFVSDRRRR